MEDEWWPVSGFDSSELCYGIPTDVKRVPSLTRKIISSSYVDSSQGYSLEFLLDLEESGDMWEDDSTTEYDISSVAKPLRDSIASVLQETDRRFGFQSDLSEWDEGYGVITEYTENKAALVECIKFLISQRALFEYCTVGVSFYFIPVSQLLGDLEFETVCEEIEIRTDGKFSIRERAELGPYDGIEPGSGFYQTFLLVSPLYEFPLQFFRAHSEDNRLASPYYHWVFSKICTTIDCKLTLLKA